MHYIFCHVLFLSKSDEVLGCTNSSYIEQEDFIGRLLGGSQNCRNGKASYLENKQKPKDWQQEYSQNHVPGGSGGWHHPSHCGGHWPRLVILIRTLSVQQKRSWLMKNLILDQ